MTATRVIDDHLELANIGTKTHAEIEGHIQGIGNYAFPAADGNADQLLKTSGAGVLSWIDQPAGFACGSLNACNLSDIGTRPHSQITDVGTSDHHVKYLDAEAVSAMGAKGDANPLHHDKYTDAEVDAIVATHTGISDAHHSPYTDAEAVAACDASDKFIERGLTNVITSTTTLQRYGVTTFFKYHWITNMGDITSDASYLLAENPAATYVNAAAHVSFPVVSLKGTDTTKNIGRIIFVKELGETKSFIDFQACYFFGFTFSVFQAHSDKIVCKPPLHLYTVKSGATQAGAGASSDEIWKTNGHASLPDNVLMIGV